MGESFFNVEIWHPPPPHYSAVEIKCELFRYFITAKSRKSNINKKYRVNFQRRKVTPPLMLKFNVSILASLNFIYWIKFQRLELTFPNSAVEIKGNQFCNF